MLVSEIKRYIKENRSVSMTDLTFKFDVDRESLEMPINILIEKGYIKVTLPIADSNSPSKCGGCPMGCKPKEQENCSPAPSFTIYNWIKD
ncbi:MAG: FeoC-like transcriptional regulator [Spirochaetaceae bacterium]